MQSLYRAVSGCGYPLAAAEAGHVDRQCAAPALPSEQHPEKRAGKLLEMQERLARNLRVLSGTYGRNHARGRRTFVAGGVSSGDVRQLHGIRGFYGDGSAGNADG